MKKMIAMMLALVLVVGLMACGSKPVEEPVVDETMDEPATMPEEDMPAEMPEVDAPVEEMPEVDAPVEEMPEIEYMPEEKLAELTEKMELLVGGINDEMMVGTMEITADTYEYYAIPAVEGAYAVVSMPMISAIAHEVILVELPEGTDAEAFAAEMEANLDPMKWVCVQPETTWVKAYGNYVVSVMSTVDMADAIAANCDTVFGA